MDGYLLTYVIAYLRDYGMAFHFAAESFETFVPWKNVVSLSNNVKTRMIAAAKKRNVPGTLWVSCRVTQLYKTGACVYFYFGFSHAGMKNTCKSFTEIEEEGRDEVLNNKGTLSHHHGVGKLRRQYMSRCVTPLGLELLKKIKKEFDPKNVFGVGNMGLTEAKISVSESPWDQVE
jgi:alkyldihydroxyacetonephosphate synthase